jgi:hypothetical protein
MKTTVADVILWCVLLLGAALAAVYYVVVTLVQIAFVLSVVALPSVAVVAMVCWLFGWRP